jgi:hypothetical protein
MKEFTKNITVQGAQKLFSCSSSNKFSSLIPFSSELFLLSSIWTFLGEDYLPFAM